MSPKQLTPVQLQFCKQITNKLIKKPISYFFRRPALSDISDGKSRKKYLDVVKCPMDLETILKKLNEQKYASILDWKHDVHLILENCQKYNGEDHPYTDMAKELFEHLFNSYVEKIPETEEEAWHLQFTKKFSKLVQVIDSKPS